MTDFASLLVPDRGQPAHVIQLVRAEGFDEWLTAQPERVRATIATSAFTPTPGSFAIVPGLKADDWSALLGAGPTPRSVRPRRRRRKAARGSDYRLSEPCSRRATSLGWLLAQHRFDRYRADPEPAAPARALLTGDPAHIDEVGRDRARHRTGPRPGRHAGQRSSAPPNSSRRSKEIANRHGAEYAGDARRHAGDKPIPMIAAVGRAAVPDARAPADRARLGAIPRTPRWRSSARACALIRAGSTSRPRRACGS